MQNISNRERTTVAAAEFWREFNETAQASMLTESLDLLSDADYALKQKLRQLYRVCSDCKTPIFYHEHDEAVVRGHVYSEAGLAELKITGLCEFCFDEITLPEDFHDF